MDGLSNSEIAAILERYGVMLQLAGESPFRARAYSRAAESVRSAPEPVANLYREHRLQTLPGVGDGLAAAIGELVTTGQYTPLAELEAAIPGTLIEILSIPGVGLKTAIRLYQELGISDLQTLSAALASGQIEQMRGLGKRTATAIQNGLESVRRRTGRLRSGTARPLAIELVGQLQTALPGAEVNVAGSIRRWEETIADIDLVVATSDVAGSVTAVLALPLVATAVAETPDRLRVRLQHGIEVDLYWSELANFGTTLVRTTGTPAHLNLLGNPDIKAATEDEFYDRLGLPWIPPELRQGSDEVRRASEIANLITLDDIRGEFHCHTTWSDGTASVAAMAAAAAARGYEFLGISDHSHGLGVANGLSPERLQAQREEITAANAQAGIRILAGAEVEIHRDGRLDYDAATLRGLDFVIASLHVGLQQPQDQLTARLLDILANRNVDVIAHPSGRLIEQREGGDFDWDRVFATAAQTGTALEINADPARLDLSAPNAARALDAGCTLTINCDSHSPSGFSLMEYGVATARKAWARPEQVINCWPLDRIETWLRDRGRP